MEIHSKLKKPIKSEIYATYWDFAAKRQDVFFKRMHQELFPWTQDPILNKYKFTNVYRASDRVSQYLIQHVIYAEGYKSIDCLFRILLFKTFNKISTWEWLELNLGFISYKTFSIEEYADLLNQALQSQKPIYSGAYMMASGKSHFHQLRKHENHLALIKLMIDDQLLFNIQKAKSFEEVFIILKSYPTIGDFLAYQYAIDINYSELIDFDENDYVMPGPGALSGIKKCFSNLGEYSEKDIIRYMTDLQAEEFERLGITFKSLWGRPLHLIDCQNLFCEVDKYSRVAHPKHQGNSGRTRIKQLFKPSSMPLTYWFPPKWGMNSKLIQDV